MTRFAIRLIGVSAAILVKALPIFLAVGAIAQGPPVGRPDRTRPGPWDNDVVVYRIANDGKATKLATFDRAGVPAVARLKDGRLIAAHQNFPESGAGFDKVAIRFSPDEGATWTAAKTLNLTGLPDGMRSPFDPTLVPLPDGGVRLYFTSIKLGRSPDQRPAIYSAKSSNGVDYTFEPGVRFAVEGRPVIDCAVALHSGVFHLYAPDNGAGLDPGAPGSELPENERPRDGAGYHATSTDGLTFTRKSDVKMDLRCHWLGNAQSLGDKIIFFGTGQGIWTATSTDGQSWVLGPILQQIQGADPGAVKLRDSTWLLIVTGPPRPGTPSAQRVVRPQDPSP